MSAEPKVLGLGAAADRLLTPDEVADRLGVKLQWVYRHAGEWPHTRRITRKVLRFSEAGFLRWIDEQKA